MLRTIKKRIIMLGNRMPFAPEKKEFFEDMERIDWIHNNMMLEGSNLTKEQIQDVMNGELFQTMKIDEPIMIERLKTIFDRMYINAQNGAPLNMDSIRYMNRVLSGSDTVAPYRKTSEIVHQWDYSAIHPADIPSEMKMLAELLEEARNVNPLTEECFEYAERIHNRIVEILPYGKNDALLARTVATYFLMEKGYPATTPSMKEQEYNEKVMVALKTGELQGFKDLLMKQVLERFDLMIQLTRY